MCRPRAGRIEEGTRQARSVELIAQRRLLELFMRSQVSDANGTMSPVTLCLDCTKQTGMSRLPLRSYQAMIVLAQVINTLTELTHVQPFG